ncbi:hypothetical protein BHE74_00029506 [Ensete ventricosum]|nr:hypothetical protein GW17_00005567 [Ensete ventricosum]RWW63342.1 hypothetical protein BHE74_00029506 [Ensete ventricosum]
MSPLPHDSSLQPVPAVSVACGQSSSGAVGVTVSFYSSNGLPNSSSPRQCEEEKEGGAVFRSKRRNRRRASHMGFPCKLLTLPRAPFSGWMRKHAISKGSRCSEKQGGRFPHE